MACRGSYGQTIQESPQKARQLCVSVQEVMAGIQALLQQALISLKVFDGEL